MTAPQSRTAGPFALPVSVDSILGDCAHGQYDAYALFDANGKSICDTLNSDLACIEQEADEDHSRTWDEVGRKNMEHIAAVLNAAVSLRAQNAALRQALNTLLLNFGTVEPGDSVAIDVARAALSQTEGDDK
jgi:hypothetical protein